MAPLRMAILVLDCRPFFFYNHRWMDGSLFWRKKFLIPGREFPTRNNLEASGTIMHGIYLLINARWLVLASPCSHDRRKILFVIGHGTG